MPLPLTASCFSKIQIGFTFLVPGSPGKGAVERLWACSSPLCRFAGCSDAATVDADAGKMADYRQVLQTMRNLWPQFDIDGVHNMWIVKPGDKSKGVGRCCIHLEMSQFQFYARQLTRHRPGHGETISPFPPMSVRRWQKSQRTGPQSAHLWWPVVAKLQAASVPVA